MQFIPNEQGFFEIRLESIGGQGAYSAGQMLAEVGVSGSALHAICFADYGSEKKGAPVKTFIRFASNTMTIRNYSPVEFPQVVVVFHEQLFMTQPVTNGLDPEGILIVNTPKTPQQIKDEFNPDVKTIVTVDGISIAMGYKTKSNTAVLGAIFKVLEFLNPEYIEKSIEKMFGYKYPHLVGPNIDTFKDGMNQAQIAEFEVSTTQSRQTIETPYGYETQLLGGVIEGANSFKKNLSASREGYLPEWIESKCIHCSNCDNVCPDYCFVWEEGTDARGREAMFLKGIDYNYCKGCLKCVQVCPTSALVDMVETQGYAEANRFEKSFPYLGGKK